MRPQFGCPDARCTEGGRPRVLRRRRGRCVSERAVLQPRVSVQMPNVRRALFSCCAPVLSRRLRSETARSALRSPAGGVGGAGLTASAPGERLPTNGATVDTLRLPWPGLTSLRARETQREWEGGRTGSQKTDGQRNGYRPMIRDTGKTDSSGQQTDSETRLSLTWTPASIPFLDSLPPGGAHLPRRPTGCWVVQAGRMASRGGWASGRGAPGQAGTVPWAQALL